MSRLRPSGLLFLTALCVFLLDRLSKWAVEAWLAGGPPVKVIPGVLDFTYATNTGGAFGILANVPWLFGLATLGVSIAIVATARKVEKPLMAVALGMILGGAVGNLVDRLGGGLALDGTVTDFIDFHVWPVFNIADCGIVIGAFLLALSTGRKTHDEQLEEAADA